MGLALALLGLAALDSLNPSAIAVSALLAVKARESRRSPWPVAAAYLSGMAVVMVAFGIAVMLGVGGLLDAVSGPEGTEWSYRIQLILGLVLFLLGLLLPSKPSRTSRFGQWLSLERGIKPGRMFFVGVAVTVIEFAGAVPYLLGLGLLLRAELPLLLWLVAILVYNAVVVVPPFFVVLSSTAFPRFFDRVLTKVNKGSGGRKLVLTLLFVLGLYLTADALYYFNIFGLFDGAPPHPGRTPSR